MNQQKLTLPINHPHTQEALRTGWLLRDDKKKVWVVAKNVIDTPSGAHITFEPVGTSPKPTLLSLWAQTTRAYSLTATLTPCLAVIAFKIFSGTPIHFGFSISAILGAVVLQIAINIFNDVEDYRRLIDLPGTLGGSGVIQNGWWTPTQLRKIAWGAFFAGVALGLPSLLAHFQTLIIVAFVAALGVLRYSARTFGFKYWALGDVAVWILCGPAIAAGVSISSTGFLEATDLFIGSYFGWLAVAILHANNLQDIPIDQKRGVKTFAIALGFKRSIRFLVFTYLFAFVSLLAAGINSNSIIPFLIPAFITIGLSLPWLTKLVRAIDPHSKELFNCRVQAAQIHLASGIALITSLLIAWRLKT